jgi:dTDP-4-dehydrorhamnose 3,5-epimerase-like enzyme
MKLIKPIVLKDFFNIFPDNRGSLSTLDIKRLYKALNLKGFDFNYQLISSNHTKGTFRGFHFQVKPYEQTKIVVVHSGSILDIVFPYEKPDKSNISKFKLSEGDVIAIPSNFAHGFYSFTDEVLLQYIMDKEYSHENYKGINGQDFINNTIENSKILISEKDLGLPKELILE